MSCRYYFHAALQSVRTVHGYGTYRVLTDVLLHFDNQRSAVRSFNGQSVVNTRKKKVCLLYTSDAADEL